MCNKSREVVKAGRGFVVLDAVACVGDTAMNGILYPASVVANNSQDLVNKPAPLGHPMIDGQAVNASNFFIKGAYDIGAAVLNSTMSGDKNLAEIWIDKEVAERSDKGKKLLDMIANREPIGVSTGLKPVSMSKKKGVDKNGNEYSQVINSFEYDHLAILIDELPAGHSAGTYIIYNAETGEVENQGSQSAITNEENQMKHEFDLTDLSKGQRVQFQSLTVNEILEAVNAKKPQVTLEEAKQVVANSGLMINSADEGEFISKEDAQLLANVKAETAERIQEMTDYIVANSDYTAEMLANKDEAELLVINKLLDVKQDYSAQSTVVTNGANASTFKAIEY